MPFAGRPHRPPGYPSLYGDHRVLGVRRGRLGMTVPSVMIADLGDMRAADAAIGPVMRMSELVAPDD